MTFRAFALPGARLELAFVRIRFVAVHAVREGQRPFEITINVALRATDLCMPSEQRIFCLGMIERKCR